MMKPHIVIKLNSPFPWDIPYWESIIQRKDGVLERSIPKIDALFGKYNIPYWLSTNFKPEQKNWTKDEIEAGLNRIYRYILQKDTNIPEALIHELKLLPEIEYAHAGGIGYTLLPGRDMAIQTALSAPYPHRRIFLQEAHLFSKGDPDITIAILDTGFDETHPEIQHAVLPGKDFVDILEGANHFIGDYLGIDDVPEDEVGHGTHVAGIIAAKGKKMPVGVVPQCKILPVKVLGALKRGTSIVGAGLLDNINNGIKWAVDQGVQVINMSLGIKHEGGGLPHEEIIHYAFKKGVTVVAASGNDGTNDRYYPGALPGVLAVGASDGQGQVAPFSTYGGHVSLIAPGTNIFSAAPGNTYALLSGTSQAAPFVSGGVALLKSFALSKGLKLTDLQIKYLLKHTSDKVDQQLKNIKAGFGELNLLDALKLLRYKIQYQS